MSKSDKIAVFMYKFFNLISAIVYNGLKIVAIICWAFVLNNTINMIKPGLWYYLAAHSKLILWLLNNVYLKYEFIQYFLIFMTQKAFWIATLTTFGLRFGSWLRDKAREAQYNFYVKKGYIDPNPQPQIIVQQAPQTQTQNTELQIANMRAQLAEQQLEIERMKNAGYYNQY